MLQYVSNNAVPLLNLSAFKCLMRPVFNIFVILPIYKMF